MAEQRLEMEQRQQLRLSAQQIRFVRLLELNAPELDDAVEREMADNPALVSAEEETPVEAPAASVAWVPRRSMEAEDYSSATPDTSETLYDHLESQISELDLPENIDQIARYIVGTLDSNGYLTRTVQEISDDLAFGPGIMAGADEVNRALEVVRQLDPPGIAARDLRDTLEMQLLRQEPSEVRDNALRIIRHAFEAFTMKHRHRIISALKLTDRQADDALALILAMNPKPGAAYGNDPSDSSNIIVPDFILNNENGELTITLNNRIPELRIEQSFDQAMRTLENTPKGRRQKGSEFIVARYNDARDFIRIISQRQRTMMAVMSAILKIQEEYFRTEDVYTLKPMMLKNIAEVTGLDFSVISRATNNKYLQTPWGIFPMRFFFSDSKGDKGGGDSGESEGSDAATNRKIEAAISDLIAKEDKRHPLSDRQIGEQLAASGLDVSRRTIAKYRDRQGIPVARLRKEM